MNSSFLISSKSDGVFLGDFLGLSLWSNLDSSGLTEAPVYLSKEDAIKFIESWEDKPEDVEVLPIMTTEKHIATTEEISMIGIKPWT